MKTELDRFFDRLEPGSSASPPSTRWNRLVTIATGVRVLEMRSPNDGQSREPADATRFQYLLAGGVLYSRHLPPARIGDSWAGAGVPRWELLGGPEKVSGLLRQYLDIARDLDCAPGRPAVGRTVERHNLDGRGARDHEVYYLPPEPEDYWRAVTSVTCPVPGCGQTAVWYEAGYVPGYRVCMAPRGDEFYDPKSICHRFLARGDAFSPCLIRE